MIDLKKFETLAEVRDRNCISFFIPTHRAGHTQEDRIRYKNMVSEVEDKLEERGMNPPEIKAKLKEAKAKIEDNDFWLHQSDGLAVYIYGEKTEFHTLPIDFDPYSIIDDRLYLKPVIPVLTDNKPFFLLALDLNNVRFFEGDRYFIAELETNEFFPKNMAQALRYDVVQENIQHHSGQGADGSAIYHGQGEGKDDENVRITEYLRLINKGVMELLCDTDEAPLIVAADTSLISLYRAVNEYPGLHAEYIPGNPEHDDAVLLHEKAWMILEAELEKDQDKEVEEFEAALARDEASFSMHDIIPAAMAGRVDTLFVDESYDVWGTYDASSHSVEIHPERNKDSVPLIEQAAVATIQHGGKVYVRSRTELPRPTANLNAMYRYAVETA